MLGMLEGSFVGYVRGLLWWVWLRALVLGMLEGSCGGYVRGLLWLVW